MSSSALPTFQGAFDGIMRFSELTSLQTAVQGIAHSSELLTIQQAVTGIMRSFEMTSLLSQKLLELWHHFERLPDSKKLGGFRITHSRGTFCPLPTVTHPLTRLC